MEKKISFPLYSPRKDEEFNKKFRMLVADVTMEKTLLSVFNVENGQGVLVEECEKITRDYSSLKDLLKDFLGDSSSQFERISISVPGPVIFGNCEISNLPWDINGNELSEALGIEKIYLINDMEATAYSLASLDEAELIPINIPNKIMPGNVAILSPGNGLGEAGLFWDGENLRPFATEGGHTEFTPRTDFEVNLYQFLHKIYGIVSWESVLSKTGLFNIYRFMRDIGRHQELPELSQKIQNTDFINAIVDEGENGNSRLVSLTLQMFSEFLAREANYLALKLKATGGLVITGELAEALRKFIDKDKFYKDFMISDKMQSLLKDIPLYFIFNKNAVTKGAAFYATFAY